jgi:hypothetical protein
LRRAELGDGKKGQRPFEGRLAGVGYVEGGGEMRLGVHEVAACGLDLTQETVGRQADQRLIGSAGQRQRLACARSGTFAVARCR